MDDEVEKSLNSKRDINDINYFENENNDISQNKHPRLEKPNGRGHNMEQQIQNQQENDGSLFQDALHTYSTSASSQALKWEDMFSLLVEWGLNYGTCNVSRNTVAVLADGRSTNLGEWLKRQRKMRRKGELLPMRFNLMQKLVDHGYLAWDKAVHTALPQEVISNPHTNTVATNEYTSGNNGCIAQNGIAVSLQRENVRESSSVTNKNVNEEPVRDNSLAQQPANVENTEIIHTMPVGSVSYTNRCRSVLFDLLHSLRGSTGSHTLPTYSNNSYSTTDNDCNQIFNDPEYNAISNTSNNEITLPPAISQTASQYSNPIINIDSNNSNMATVSDGLFLQQQQYEELTDMHGIPDNIKDPFIRNMNDGNNLMGITTETFHSSVHDNATSSMHMNTMRNTVRLVGGSRKNYETKERQGMKQSNDMLLSEPVNMSSGTNDILATDPRDATFHSSLPGDGHETESADHSPQITPTANDTCIVRSNSTKVIRADPEDIIQHSIATFPIPLHYRRVNEKRFHLRCYGVSVMPDVEGTNPVNENENENSSGHRYKRFWYCCASQKCFERDAIFDITHSPKTATAHLRRVHHIYAIFVSNGKLITNNNKNRKSNKKYGAPDVIVSNSIVSDDAVTGDTTSNIPVSYENTLPISSQEYQPMQHEEGFTNYDNTNQYDKLHNNPANNFISGSNNMNTLSKGLHSHKDPSMDSMFYYMTDADANQSIILNNNELSTDMKNILRLFVTQQWHPSMLDRSSTLSSVLHPNIVGQIHTCDIIASLRLLYQHLQSECNMNGKENGAVFDSNIKNTEVEYIRKYIHCVD